MRCCIGVDVDLSLVDLNLVRQSDSVFYAMEKVKLIRDILRTTQIRHKSYGDVRRRVLEFQVDDWVFLKVSPMKGVMKF